MGTTLIITESQAEADLLSEIETFLAESGMGETYFGKRSSGNSEVVSRLRNGGSVLLKTEKKIRDFIKLRRHEIKHVSAVADIQEKASEKVNGATQRGRK